MKLDFLLFGDECRIDAAEKLSVVGVFDTLTISPIPSLFRGLSVAMRFQPERNDLRRGREFGFLFQLLAPSGAETGKAEGRFMVSDALDPKLGITVLTRCPVAFTFPKLEIREAGRYRALVAVDGKPLGEERLQVRLG